MAPNVYDYIAECTSFEIALQTLKTMYIKPKNEIFAWHLLATCKQRPGETLDQFLVEPKTLAKDCNFANITAEQYRSESIRDAFINGISSNNIRQRLLENKTLDLNTAFDQARSLDVAQQSSNVYNQSAISPFNTTTASVNIVPKHSLIQPALSTSSSSSSAAVKPKQTCWFCGRHPRNRCPAREAQCHKCKKVGHFEKMCRSAPVSTAIPKSRSDDDEYLFLATTTGSSTSAAGNNPPFRVSEQVLLNDTYKAEALIDSGSTDKSFISSKLAKLLNVKVIPTNDVIGMASASLSAKSDGHCYVSLTLQDKKYKRVKLTIIDNLCTDIILGTDFQELHESIVINYRVRIKRIAIAKCDPFFDYRDANVANSTKFAIPNFVHNISFLLFSFRL